VTSWWSAAATTENCAATGPAADESMAIVVPLELLKATLGDV